MTCRRRILSLKSRNEVFAAALAEADPQRSALLWTMVKVPLEDIASGCR